VRLPWARTFAAAVLVVVALGLPCAAWYTAGRAAAEREATRLEDEARTTATRSVQQLAAQLDSRLENLRERESRRPYFQYQSVYHDPNVAAQGLAVAPSPLARGPDDPLVRAHFRVDSAGRLELPTLGAEVGDLLPAAEQKRQRETLVRLERSKRECVEWLAVAAPVSDRGASGPATSKTIATQQQAVAQVEMIDRSAFTQNVQASSLYQELKSPSTKKGDTPTSSASTKGTAKSPGISSAKPGATTTKNTHRGTKKATRPPREPTTVKVDVGPFEWHTLASTPMLVALRSVRGPDLRLAQGFVVDSAEVARILASSPVSATFVNGSPSRGVDAPVGATGWSVSAEISSNVVHARDAAASIRARFRRDFGIGSGAAALAGLAMVGMVFQAERLARRRSRFAASAAHELRTPLAALRMHGEMLAEGLGDPERSRDYAAVIASESERLGRVVTNVLDFSRLERGGLRITPVIGDLGAVVRDTVERQRLALEASGAPVELTVADVLPSACFDADALRQILLNLLDNAERYARESRDRTISVSVSPQGAHVAVTVADRGPGMPRRRGPFAWLGAMPHPASGLGIGLHLVRALTGAMGGSVSMRDVEGGGTAATVLIPVAQ
jgi:signal transduction histidine kinase